MKTNPNDVFLSYSKFKGELINEVVNDLKRDETMESNQRFHGSEEHCLFNLEDKYYLLMYIFDIHNIDIIESIRKGKFTNEKNYDKKFLCQNPQLMFYQYILLKDQDGKYNIGYFTEKIRVMIKVLVELNIFFLDAYIICKVMDKVFNWKNLEPKLRSKTRLLRIGFNNILMVGYNAGKPYLIVNENGLKNFDSYSTGKISLALYSEEDLLYCRRISVPNFSQEVREAIFKGEVGEDKEIKWSKFLPPLDSDIMNYPPIYREVTEWLKMSGLILDIPKTKN